uniref:Uncharacterized protein n=1 Tax=Arundo donax TaxID=35708 RepID=A0A0A8ZYS3_ARUDO
METLEMIFPCSCCLVLFLIPAGLILSEWSLSLAQSCFYNGNESLCKVGYSIEVLA